MRQQGYQDTHFTQPYAVPRKKSKGLGDQIAKVTKATGIDKAVKAVVGEDCGCDERRAKLNHLFPNRNVEMTPEDAQRYRNLLKELGGRNGNREQSREFYDIYNRTFNTKEKPCRCPGKNVRMKDRLDKALEFSCEE